VSGDVGNRRLAGFRREVDEVAERRIIAIRRIRGHVKGDSPLCSRRRLPVHVPLDRAGWLDHISFPRLVDIHDVTLSDVGRLNEIAIDDPSAGLLAGRRACAESAGDLESSSLKPVASQDDPDGVGTTRGVGLRNTLELQHTAVGVHLVIVMALGARRFAKAAGMGGRWFILVGHQGQWHARQRCGKEHNSEHTRMIRTFLMRIKTGGLER
jgi:hypothetical protein